MLRFIRSICIALFILMVIDAQAQDLNRVPNAAFEGTDGDVFGNVTGQVPDYWRAFALEGGDVSISIVPVNANELYPGSQSTNAVQLTFNSFGAAQGFDHEGTPFSFIPDHSYSTEVYMRTANSGGDSQGVSVSVPVFDVNGFTGRQPGSFEVTATSQWVKFTGPSFKEVEGTAGDLAFRLKDDGGENSILIAMPTVNGPAGIIPEVGYPATYTPGRNFSATDRYVSTTVFHWYNVFGGQVSGPWRPLEGRGNWTGESAWWREQIKDMMDANIDVLYVHLLNSFGYQREEFFKALHQLRREGYNTPYVLPFLDPLIIWDNNPIDMSQSASKDEYVSWYQLWFEQYFRQDTGDYAESRLLHINNKVVLNTWHGNPGATDNLSALTRNDVESRLSAAFGTQYPSFKNGIYQIATTNGVAPSFADELANQFSNAEYFSTHTFNGKRPATVIPGIWDQNVRTPGFFFPRDGGASYVQAWNDLNLARNGGGGQLPIYHGYVESWNEYDEGTGIYSGDPGLPYIAPDNMSGNTDEWSGSDNPREYINTTHAGASEFNDHPDLDSEFLWHDIPPTLQPGESTEVQVLVRNAGDIKWSDATGIKLAQTDSGGHPWGPARQSIDPGPNEVAKYGGVFRGRPVLFKFTITAPQASGVYQVNYRMVRNDGGETEFGDQLTAQITIGPAPVENGHSGAFFNPLRNGEGNYVEMLSDSSALIYTFSFRPDGSGPAWFLGVGDVQDDSIVISDLLRPTGTSFGNEFNTNDIVFSPAGSMAMNFLDCESITNEGSVVFSGDPGIRYEALVTRASRLSQITGCGETAAPNAGLSGSFYDAGRNGEGLVIQWLTNGQVLIIMFSYDLKGDQFWTLGLGTPNGKSVTIEALYPSTPTSWGSKFDPDEVRLSPWGTITLSWTSCDTVTFEYDSVVAGFGSATRQYTRISNLAGTQCPDFP